ncbi:MAG TPA: crotonase [Chloroflexi bacterium]|nr:crotonase [Chloroflexota bacterium]
MENSGTVRVEQIDAIALITLDRPEKHNALSQSMRDSLIRKLGELAADETVRVVVLTGAGKVSFCVGTDVSEFLGRSGLTQWERDIDPFRLFEVIERFPKPVLTMINGYAYGGGCELALACDIRISSTNSQFGQLEVNFGLIPGGGGTQRLTRLVGRGQAMRMILGGERIPASEAWRIGLVDLLVPPTDLWETTFSVARAIAERNPAAVRLAKEAIRSVDEMSLSAGLRYEASLMGICLYESGSEATISAFLGKKGGGEQST